MIEIEEIQTFSIVELIRYAHCDWEDVDTETQAKAAEEI